MKIHVGASAKATHWLIDQVIKVTGTDGWGWDIPIYLQIEKFKNIPNSFTSKKQKIQNE